MEKRNITITLEKAKEWYYSNNKSLKEIALQAFDEKELMFNFKDIKTFKDACNVLNLDRADTTYLIRVMTKISKASAAMYQLNIIRKALNLGQELHFIQSSNYIYCPYNPIITTNSTYYKKQLNLGEMEIIGKIKSREILYNVLGGYALYNSTTNLSGFNFGKGVSNASMPIAILGCATKEIAQHFSKYFGMLITEAKYGDIADFEVIKNFKNGK